MGLSRFFAPSSVLRLTNKGTLCSRELNFEINLSDIVDTINVPTSEGLDGYIGIQASFGILSIHYKREWEEDYLNFYNDLLKQCNIASEKSFKRPA